MPDLVKQLLYIVVGRVFHQPFLLRAVCKLLARYPGLSRYSPGLIVASRDAVRGLLRRVGDFSHTAYQTSLVTGDFLIGMDKGPGMLSDRRMLLDWVRQASPTTRAERPSVTESRLCLEDLRQERKTRFDLIEDYLMDVVWSELRFAVGSHSDLLAQTRYRERRGRPHLLDDLRYLGANLVVGWVAPKAVEKKVSACAASVRDRVTHLAARIGAGFDPPLEGSDALIRNAIGMMWVGHPATVQAGALMIQELLARPGIHAELGARVQGLKESAWDDPLLRRDLREHVLELLRFRPVFPLVPRHAIRDTALDLGRGRVIPVKAGTRVVAGLVGAMFDPEASWAPDVYHPGRHREKWVREEEDELLMFGLGERNCIAEHMVPDILVSALIGLLQMPGLRWPDRRLFEPRITYDGVIITRMPLVIDPLG